MADNLLLELRQNDTFSLPVTYKDSNGVAVDLTGYTYEFYIFGTTYTDDPEVTVVDLTHGKVSLNLTAAQTNLFCARRGSYYFTVIDGSGNRTTLLEGDVDVDLISG